MCLYNNLGFIIWRKTHISFNLFIVFSLIPFFFLPRISILSIDAHKLSQSCFSKKSKKPISHCCCSSSLLGTSFVPILFPIDGSSQMPAISTYFQSYCPHNLPTKNILLFHSFYHFYRTHFYDSSFGPKPHSAKEHQLQRTVTKCKQNVV